MLILTNLQELEEKKLLLTHFIVINVNFSINSS